MQQYLVIMRMGDTKDPEIQRKRAELRDAHLKRAADFRDRGHVIIGGAVLDADGTPAGSAAIARFETRPRSTPLRRSRPKTAWKDFEIIPSVSRITCFLEELALGACQAPSEGATACTFSGDTNPILS
jgi:uncharacterized protein YciI